MFYRPIIRRRTEASEAVRATGLGGLAAGRLSRWLDRALRNDDATQGLRGAVRDAVQELVEAGVDPGIAVSRLVHAVEEHAYERGLTRRSLVSRRPRFADVAPQVAAWAQGQVAEPTVRA